MFSEKQIIRQIEKILKENKRKMAGFYLKSAIFIKICFENLRHTAENVK